MSFEENVELMALSGVGSEGEAAMVIGRLEAEGIRAVANPSIDTPGAWGSVRCVVLVRSEDLERARQALAGEA